jgi:hypothetical protein
MNLSRQGFAGACVAAAIAAGCGDNDPMNMTFESLSLTDVDATSMPPTGTTADGTTFDLTQPTEDTFADTTQTPDDTTTTPDDTTNPDDTTTTPLPTTEPDETTTTAPPDTDTDTGGLPDGYLAVEQRYPSDLVIVDGQIYWANNWVGDCVRRAPLAGGPFEDIACEPTDSYFPLQVMPYADGKIAWTFMSDGGGPQTLGFGGVRQVDGPGMPIQTLDDQARFKSSSSGAICNDSIAAEGANLYWYSHILGGFNDGVIERYNGTATDVFVAGSEFPYGVVTTPTSVYFSATEDYAKLAHTAIPNTPPTIVGMTQGSSCGRAAAGETVYVTSRGTFAGPGALFVVSGAGVSKQRDLDELAYDLAVDATHLYFAYPDRIDRLPLADLQTGAPETVVYADTSIGGVLVDATNIYWSEYDYAGSVRVQPK